MEFEVVKVYQGGPDRSRHYEAWAAKRLGMVDDEAQASELHAYSAAMKITPEEHLVARMLGVAEETLRESKARHLLYGQGV